jgi:hypothetical protein
MLRHTYLDNDLKDKESLENAVDYNDDFEVDEDEYADDFSLDEKKEFDIMTPHSNGFEHNVIEASESVHASDQKEFEVNEYDDDFSRSSDKSLVTAVNRTHTVYKDEIITDHPIEISTKFIEDSLNKSKENHHEFDEYDDDFQVESYGGASKRIETDKLGRNEVEVVDEQMINRPDHDQTDEYCDDFSNDSMKETSVSSVTVKPIERPTILLNKRESEALEYDSDENGSTQSVTQYPQDFEMLAKSLTDFDRNDQFSNEKKLSDKSNETGLPKNEYGRNYPLHSTFLSQTNNIEDVQSARSNSVRKTDSHDHSLGR